MMTEEERQKEIRMAFNHDAYAEKCRKGLTDDKEFYQAIEENEKRALRSLRESFTFVVR
jgi:hypothetical protein